MVVENWRVLRRVNFLLVLAALVTFSRVSAAQNHSVPLPTPPPEKEPKDDPKEEPSKKPKKEAKPKDPLAGKKRHDPGTGSSGSSSGSSRSEDEWWTWEEKESDSTPSTPTDVSSSKSTTTPLNLRGFASLGGHVTIANPNLALLGRKIGWGADLSLGLGPRTFPVYFGTQLGFDSFGSETEHFTHLGEYAEYDLSRFAGWVHGLVRVSPMRGRLRPYIDLLGGVWHYNVSIQDPDEVTPTIDDTTILGGSTTGSYGIGLGLQYVTRNNFTLGLSAVHMRGGKMTVPDASDTEVVDGVLYYGEITVAHVAQWMILFEVGGLFD